MTGYDKFKSAPTTDQLSQLSTLVRQMHDAELELAKAESELAIRKDALREVAEKQIPELMAQVGIKTFETSDGFVVSIKKTYTAAPTVAQRDEAYDWLEQHGHGGLVKRTVEVGFGVKQGAEAAALMDKLRKDFEDVRGERKVESATLRAWVRQRIESGDAFPRELFNARVFDRADVKQK
jgi:hypothetical protein